MSMHMPPQVGQQALLPDVNRTSLVLFGGLALVVVNLVFGNGANLLSGIFHKGSGEVQLTGISDAGWQLLGVLLLTLLAQYGGENAGTASLMFVGALWALWLLTHFRQSPAPSHSEPSASPTNRPTSGGSGGQKL